MQGGEKQGSNLSCLRTKGDGVAGEEQGGHGVGQQPEGWSQGDNMGKAGGA